MGCSSNGQFSNFFQVYKEKSEKSTGFEQNAMLLNNISDVITHIFKAISLKNKVVLFKKLCLLKNVV
jgi:hypothetical protein